MLLDLYPMLKPLLFKIDAEKTHTRTMSMLQKMPYIIPRTVIEDPVTVMGISFPNRLGLAAGLDKNGVAVPAFDRMGFGFVEVGTATPKPQPGNAKPRMFRIPEYEAVINRMGFNNNGINSLVNEVAAIKHNVRAVIGINVGKNTATSNENAAKDYKYCIETATRYADYITINISSPNSPGIRDLFGKEYLSDLLFAVKMTQRQCEQRDGKYTPLVVKLSPDSTEDELDTILDCIKEQNIDGIIASNSTVNKAEIADSPMSEERGGLSGAPLRYRALDMIRIVRSRLPDIPLIASGGVMSAQDYLDRLEAGADLVQVFTGLIYRGPQLVNDCLKSRVPLRG